MSMRAWRVVCLAFYLYKSLFSVKVALPGIRNANIKLSMCINVTSWSLKQEVSYNIVLNKCSRPSQSPVNCLRSVISGCRVTRMERNEETKQRLVKSGYCLYLNETVWLSMSQLHLLSQYFVVTIRLTCSLFFFFNLYLYVQCLRGGDCHFGHLNRYIQWRNIIKCRQQRNWMY